MENGFEALGDLFAMVDDYYCETPTLERSYNLIKQKLIDLEKIEKIVLYAQMGMGCTIEEWNKINKIIRNEE